MLSHSEKLQLRTLPDENLDGSARYFVVWSVGLTNPSWVLRDEFGVQNFKTLALLFRTLGGMVRWERWDDESREWFLSRNNDKPI